MFQSFENHPHSISFSSSDRYAHVGGDNNALVEGTIPTDPTSGYSHINLDDLDGFTEDAVEEVRFYCTTSHTSRVIHFKTGNAFQAGVAFDGSL